MEDTTVAAQTIRDLAYARGGRWRRIVTDEVTGFAMNAVVKSYRPPERMARVVRARDGRCRAPGCTRPAATVDLDHVRERHEGGPTCTANLQSLCRLHHSKKTRHHWTATIADDGTVQWRLPGERAYTTFPMDYRELGRDVVDREPDAQAKNTATGVEATKDRSAALRQLAPRDTDPLTAWLDGREADLRGQIARLRTELHAEKAAHRACRREYEEFRVAHPPF